MNDTRKRTTARGWALVLSVAVLTGVSANAVPAEAGATPQRRAAPRTSVACSSTPDRATACGLVRRFFDNTSNGRFAASCALLGRELLAETGGARCPSLMRYAYFAWERSWAVVGTRATRPGIGVIVRLELPELDHVRRLLWLATVAREGTRFVIQDTRIVGFLGSAPAHTAVSGPPA
jgi:hypothetical protein